MDKMKKMFLDARRTLNEKNKSQFNLKKDWDESWPEYLKRGRNKERQAFLDAHIAHRKCPICKKVKLRSRQWVVLRNKNFLLVGHKIICKSCWMVIKHKNKEDKMK